MSEEVVLNEPVVEQSEAHEPSPVEQEALAQGWVPKEEFEGDEAKWVDAGEFVRRGELFKKIEHQNRETKALRKALMDFKELHSKVNEAAYQRALRDLKAEYKSANREGDFEKADKLEVEIAAVEAEAVAVKKQIQQVATDTQIHPEFSTWVAKNDWYATQPHMKTYADQVGINLAQSGATPAEVLKKVEEAVRKEFPNKFTNPNRARPGIVEGTSNKSPSKSEKFELSDQERKVMNNLVSSGVLTKDEYIADLKKLKESK
jgi:hypothetical protein